MTATIKVFADIIAAYDIKRYRQYGGAYEFVAAVDFTDGSTLYIRDYLFGDGSRKYAFHWEDREHKLIRRGDNAEHYPHLTTFPFHVHTTATVEEAPPMTLHKVLEYIRAHFPIKSRPI
ncbi:hypothetical protein HUU05_21305, partial [candidate division KSB1 bacterium]|nr:hypothetical protein [candidate division KSB1 bacterium]